MPDQLLNTLEVTARTKTELDKARSVRIFMPFVTLAGVGILLNRMKSSKKPLHICLLTRFDAESIIAGVCDIEALRKLLAQKALFSVEIRLIDNLHAKCFIFDARSLIVGSSNMTVAGQANNIELGFFSSSRASVDSALLEFDCHWQKSVPVDDTWLNEQHNFLEPFRKRYSSLRSEMRGLMELQSLRMPGVENNFLASLKIVLRKAESTKGMTKSWLETELLKARKTEFIENDIGDKDEPKLNIGKRIIFLELLGLVKPNDDAFFLTDFGKACLSDEKLLLKKMVAVYPILSRSYNATKDGEKTFKLIADIDPDPSQPNGPSQSLRNAIHWLTAFGLLSEEKKGNTYYFRRKRSTRATLLSSH